MRRTKNTEDQKDSSHIERKLELEAGGTTSVVGFIQKLGDRVLT